MKKSLYFGVAALAALTLSACGGAGSGADQRNAVRAVGSSTVYPFAKAVAEAFARSNPEAGSPIMESTGTGGGISLFCSGVGANTPDIANASRRMKADEFATCQANGVTEITEIQVGMDGLAFASAQGGITMNLTPEIVYRALAANPYGEAQTAKLWSDVDPSPHRYRQRPPRYIPRRPKTPSRSAKTAAAPPQPVRSAPRSAAKQSPASPQS